MKQILYDLGLVIIILCLGHIYFDDYNVQKVMFDRDIVSFEDRIENDEEVSSYGIYQDKEDNKISLFLLKVSQTCVRIIEYIVYIFSQIVSMLFNIMVY